MTAAVATPDVVPVPTRRVLETFEPLPLAERLFVRGRLFTAPLTAMAQLAPARGAIADIGCGHGALSALLALGSAARSVSGVDPDEWKISLAKRGPGRLANASFTAGTVEEFARDREGRFDAVLVADVLYLLPLDRWQSFLRACRALLVPDGTLFLKEADANGTWKHRKSALQELLMVRFAGRTMHSGTVRMQSRAVMAEELQRAGFRVAAVDDLSRGYSTPHVLFTALPD